MTERIETLLAALARNGKATTDTQKAVLDVVRQHTTALAQILALMKAEPEGGGLKALTDAVGTLTQSLDQQTVELRALRQSQEAFQQALGAQIGSAIAAAIDEAVNGAAALPSG